MKISQLVLALAGTLMCTGCSDLISLHPFVTDKEAARDARLPGVWVGDDGLYTVTAEGNGYAISRTEKKLGAVYKLKAKLLKVGEATILDLMAEDEDPFQVAVHTPLRVWLEGATLRMAFLDSKWLREQATAQLAAQQVNDRLLIASPGEAVTRFLVTHGADDRAHGEPTVLTRQK